MNRKIIAVYIYGSIKVLREYMRDLIHFLIEENIPLSKVDHRCIPFRITTRNVEIVLYSSFVEQTPEKIIGRTFDEMFSFPTYMKQYIRLSKDTTNWQGSIIDYVKTMEGIYEC